MRRPLQVVWFKRDLRIADHRPLALAAAAGPVLPLYIVEPGLWAQRDASGRQWAFAAECLEELAASLARLGQPLCVVVGEAVEVLGKALEAAPGIAEVKPLTLNPKLLAMPQCMEAALGVAEVKPDSKILNPKP